MVIELNPLGQLSEGVPVELVVAGGYAGVRHGTESAFGIVVAPGSHDEPAQIETPCSKVRVRLTEAAVSPLEAGHHFRYVPGGVDGLRGGQPFEQVSAGRMLECCEPGETAWALVWGWGAEALADVLPPDAG